MLTTLNFYIKSIVLCFKKNIVGKKITCLWIYTLFKFRNSPRMEIERGLTQERLQRNFTSVENGWKIRDEVRGMASFRKLNLMEDFSALGRFDIIFCRNVAIYFTEADKVRLFSKLGKALASDGALIIGSTESLTGLCPQFEAMRYLRSVYYRLK